MDRSEAFGRPVLFGLSVLIVFTAGFFELSGRLSLPRAVGPALALALLVSCLLILLTLRWNSLPEMRDGPSHFLVLCAVTALPVPFLLAQGEGNWRDCPLLFDATREIITRAMVAFFFTVAVSGGSRW